MKPGEHKVLFENLIKRITNDTGVFYSNETTLCKLRKPDEYLKSIIEKDRWDEVVEALVGKSFIKMIKTVYADYYKNDDDFDSDWIGIFGVDSCCGDFVIIRAGHEYSGFPMGKGSVEFYDSLEEAFSHLSLTIEEYEKLGLT